LTFTFIDIILFLGISQGIFLAAALRLLHNRNRRANHILSLTLLFAVVMLLGRILVFKIQGDWIGPLAILVDTTIFLFGPLLYLYTRRLLFEPSMHRRKDWRHGIPAGIHLIYAIIVIGLSLVQRTPIRAYAILGLTGFIVETLGLISLMIYTLQCFFVLRRHQNVSQYSLSYMLKIRRYLKVIIGVMAFFVILWLMSYMNSYFFRIRLPYLNYNTLWISVPLFIYSIGYFGLRQPEIFRVPNIPAIKKEKARLKPDEIQTLQKRLNFFMQEEHLYVQSNLTLKGLAEKLNTTPNDLSWLLNQVYQQSFYDFINKHRIDAFLLKIEHKEHIHHTLLGLALDVGFNSKSTFNKAFKTITGLTPTAYIKNQKVA